MNTSSYAPVAARLVVTGSGGLVARHGDRLLVIPDLDGACRRDAESLVRLCFDNDVADGSLLLRRAAYLLTDPGAVDLPGFCLLVSTPAGQARLLVYGSVQVSVPSELTTISASDRVTWIEHHVGDLRGLHIAASGSGEGSPAATSPWLDLRAGVVAGNAATLVATVAGNAATLVATEMAHHEDLQERRTTSAQIQPPAPASPARLGRPGNRGTH